MPDPFRWAILGTGPVARKFVLGLRQLEGRAVAHVVASRDLNNAENFAQSFNIPVTTADYASAVAEEEVDAVYVATPPSLHEAHACLAIAAGKAVLVEKPIATDAPAAERIAQAAQAAGVFCMEAMWTRFLPLLALVKADIEAGALGELRGFEGRFMVANHPAPDTTLFDPDRGGGAMMHRGIYPLSLARFFLGPVKDSRVLTMNGASTVDEDSALLLRHTSGALTSLRASLRATGPEGTMIYGTRATLHLEGPIWRPNAARLVPVSPAGPDSRRPRKFEALRESRTGLRLSGLLSRLRSLAGTGEKRISGAFSGNGYHYEAEAVMQAVAAGRHEDTLMPLAESIEIMQIIDTCRSGLDRTECQ